MCSYFHRHKELHPHINLGQDSLTVQQTCIDADTQCHPQTCTFTDIALAQIKLCYNNPIWDGLVSDSENIHIIML